VDGHADRARAVLDSSLYGLANPPGRIGRELVAAAPIELLRRANQAEDALLDEVEEREPVTLIALRDRDDEPQVRVDHALLRRAITALDELGKLDLLSRGQERAAPDLVQEDLKAVGRARCELAVRIVGIAGAVTDAVVCDLDASPLELFVELLDDIVLEPESGRQGLDLGQRKTAVPFSLLDEGDDVVRKLDWVRFGWRHRRRRRVWPGGVPSPGRAGYLEHRSDVSHAGDFSHLGDEIIGERAAGERAAERRHAVVDIDVHVTRGNAGLAERVAPDSLGDRLVVNRDAAAAEEPAGKGDEAAQVATGKLGLADPDSRGPAGESQRAVANDASPSLALLRVEEVGRSGPDQE
jgi:hypothetical protein